MHVILGILSKIMRIFRRIENFFVNFVSVCETRIIHQYSSSWQGRVQYALSSGLSLTSYNNNTLSGDQKLRSGIVSLVVIFPVFSLTFGVNLDLIRIGMHDNTHF